MIGLHHDVLEMFSHLEGCADFEGIDVKTGNVWKFSDPHPAADAWLRANDPEYRAPVVHTAETRRAYKAEHEKKRFDALDPETKAKKNAADLARYYAKKGKAA